MKIKRVKMNTIKHMREVVQPQTRKVGFLKIWIGDHWLGALVARHFSIYISWMFVKLGFSANMVTLLMIILAIAGSAFLVPHVLWMNISGLFLLLLAEVFDAVDGEVARWNNQCSIKGRYLDLVSHVLCNSMLYVFCPLHLYFLTNKTIFLILGFVCYMENHAILGLTYAYQIVRLSYQGKDSSLSSATKASGYHEGSSFRKNKLLVALKLASYSTDMVVVMIVSAIAIFISYFGSILQMIIVTWFVVVSQGLLLVGRICVKYFVQLPDVKHMRETGFEKRIL